MTCERCEAGFNLTFSLVSGTGGNFIVRVRVLMPGVDPGIGASLVFSNNQFSMFDLFYST